MRAPNLDIMAFGQIVIALRRDRLVCVAITPPDHARRRGGGNAPPIISWAGDP